MVLIGLLTDEVTETVDVVCHLLAAVSRCLRLLLRLQQLLLERLNALLEEALLRHHLGSDLVLVANGLPLQLQALFDDVALPCNDASLAVGSTSQGGERLQRG